MGTTLKLCAIEILICNACSQLDTLKNDLKLRRCWSSSPSHSICGAYKLRFSICCKIPALFLPSRIPVLVVQVKEFKLEIIFLHVKDYCTQKDNQTIGPLSITSQISVNLTILSSWIIKMLT